MSRFFGPATGVLKHLRAAGDPAGVLRSAVLLVSGGAIRAGCHPKAAGRRGAAVAQTARIQTQRSALAKKEDAAETWLQRLWPPSSAHYRPSATPSRRRSLDRAQYHATGASRIEPGRPGPITGDGGGPREHRGRSRQIGVRLRAAHSFSAPLCTRRVQAAPGQCPGAPGPPGRNLVRVGAAALQLPVSRQLPVSGLTYARPRLAIRR